ncbi:MAG: M20/M25/M40 family metallo-hydrolase [Planctomycetota bacterium]|nr:M20/M25/M40 family metallo-hydrolase [Planctomycetota bacterium]
MIVPLLLTLGALAGGDDPIPKMLKEVSPKRIHRDVETLVGFHTRQTFSETESDERGIGAARRWLAKELQAISEATGGRLEVREQRFTRRVSRRSEEEGEVVNVIGFLPGTQEDPLGRTYVVIGHYDSRASRGSDTDSFAPGADDDASGTAVVLELARVLSELELEANLVFLCVAGEEQGLYGSRHFAQRAREDGLAIDGVITNDIVGGIEGGNGVVDLVTVRCFSGGDDQSDSGGPSRELGRSLYDAAARYVPDARVRLIFRLDRLGRGGDHIPFHEQGLPALRLTEANENYARQHQDVREEDGVAYGDVLEHVSAEYVARVARVNAALLAQLALAPPAPQGMRVRGAVRYDTRLSWEPVEGAAGYVAVWRETTSPVWEHRSDVVTEPSVLLEGVIVDNHFFGVRAVDAAGHESRTTVPAGR